VLGEVLRTSHRKTGLPTKRIRLSLACTFSFIRTCEMEKGHDICYVEFKEPVKDGVSYGSCKGISEV
jgi:hypothetical protein